MKEILYYDTICKPFSRLASGQLLVHLSIASTSWKPTKLGLPPSKASIIYCGTRQEPKKPSTVPANITGISEAFGYRRKCLIPRQRPVGGISGSQGAPANRGISRAVKTRSTWMQLTLIIVTEAKSEGKQSKQGGLAESN